MPTVLITGTGRGLGYEFVRQYAADGWSVIATVRDPGAASDLAAVSANIRVERLDVSDFAAISAFPNRLGGITFDALICNAGIMGPRQIAAEEWAQTLATNTIAPTLIADALVDRIAPGGKVIAITSQMGSIADNQSGGFHAYRSSKAGLNAAWRSLAIDWRDRDLVVAMLHPGWVQTDMGGASAPIQATESVAGMIRVIDGLTKAQSGSFLDFRGKTLPW